jgi:hypothetical protein
MCHGSQPGGILEIEEMGYAERDQGQAVEHPRDAQPLVAGGEAEAPPVPVTGEPGVQNPGARRHHRGVTTAPPGIQDRGSAEDVRHPEQQQPNQEKGEQHAGSDDGCTPPEQADARGQRDEGAEIGKGLAPGKTLGHPRPCLDQIALNQAHDSEGDQGHGEDRMAHACDARPLGSWAHHREDDDRLRREYGCGMAGLLRLISIGEYSSAALPRSQT